MMVPKEDQTWHKGEYQSIISSNRAKYGTKHIESTSSAITWKIIEPFDLNLIEWGQIWNRLCQLKGVQTITTYMP